MPKFSANLSYLFGEIEFLERFEKAASAGFRSDEFYFPCAHDNNELTERVRGAGVEVGIGPVGKAGNLVTIMQPERAEKILGFICLPILESCEVATFQNREIEKRPASLVSAYLSWAW